MREPSRTEPLLGLLQELWERPENQDQRLGQLLVNLIRKAEGLASTTEAGYSLFETEDDELFQIIDRLLDEAPTPVPTPTLGAGKGLLMIPHALTGSMELSEDEEYAIKRAVRRGSGKMRGWPPPE